LDRRKDQGSLLHKENVDEDSLWVIMLLSAFDQLGGLKIEYSMLFQIKNPNTERVTRCSSSPTKGSSTCRAGYLPI
ncbi:hypothetical protein ACJX0J_042325, partial [Zea mays]